MSLEAMYDFYDVYDFYDIYGLYDLYGLYDFYDFYGFCKMYLHCPPYIPVDSHRAVDSHTIRILSVRLLLSTDPGSGPSGGRVGGGGRTRLGNNWSY